MIESMARRAGISFSEQVRCLALIGLREYEYTKDMHLVGEKQ
jgi:hypothetical protein